MADQQIEDLGFWDNEAVYSRDSSDELIVNKKNDTSSDLGGEPTRSTLTTMMSWFAENMPTFLGGVVPKNGSVPGPTQDDIDNNRVLRADGTWAAGGGNGSTPGGAVNSLQYNNNNTGLGGHDILDQKTDGIKGRDLTTDVAPTTIHYTGQGAFSGATTNTDGGDVYFESGQGSTPNANWANGGITNLRGKRVYVSCAVNTDLLFPQAGNVVLRFESESTTGVIVGAINQKTLRLTGEKVILGATVGTGDNIEIELRADAGNNLLLVNLPVSDPGVLGAVWNNGGVLNISAGP